MITFEPLEYGFKYGSASVTRVCSDEKKGWVVIGIDTPKKNIQVYVTKTGKVRLYDEGREIDQA